jgi:hypothetical protein
MASQPGSSAPAHRAAEIDVDEARKAFFLMVGFIGLIWLLQVANWADHYHLDASFGILPSSSRRSCTSPGITSRGTPGRCSSSACLPPTAA